MNKTTLLIILAFSISAFGQSKKTDLKIMSYNIKHGEGMDGILDLARSAKIIKAQSPDLCGLQEIDENCTRSNKVKQTEFLAKNTCMTGTFGTFMDYQGGEYGLSTLSVKPLISTKVLKLPKGTDEPRSAIIQEVEIAKNCIIAFANVHFDWVENSPYRLEQAKTLIKYIDQLNRPTVITGDFNCEPNSATMKYFAEQGFVFMQKGKDNLSFQGGEKVEIDHVIFRSSEKVKFTPKNIKLLNEPIVSDHRPLVAELKVKYDTN